MKKTSSFLLATLGIAATSVHAQSVPAVMSYQGRVTDSTGAGLGTGTPVNRKIIFRLFDAPTAGNRIWSEEQTVTIAGGEFSVLLGTGIDVFYNALQETPRPSLDLAFAGAGSGRYLEMVVDNGDGILNGSDTAITPRQQLTSSAFCFRAQSADSIAGSADLTIRPTSTAVTAGSVAENYGLGWYGSDRPFGGISVDGPVLYGKNGGALGSSDGATKSIALSWDGLGNVGMGTTSPRTKLDIRGAIIADSTLAAPPAATVTGGNGARLIMWPGNDSVGGNPARQPFALGIESGAMWNSVPEGGAYKWYVGNNALMTLKQNGNLGLGMTNPTSKLQVASGNIAIDSGDLKIAARGVVEFGAGVTKEVSAGKIGYGTFSNGASLDIVGAGTTGTNRKVTIFAEGGAVISGPTTISGGTVLDGPTIITGTTNVQGLAILNNVGMTTASVSGNANVNGSMAVGGTNSSKGKLCVYGSVQNSPNAGNVSFFGPASAFSANAANNGAPVGIYAEHGIWSSSVIVSSDERIKNIQGPSNGTLDLQTLQGIQVTDYVPRDTISKGSRPVKKVIAQQVEKVFPQAVSVKTDVVPDIYKKAEIKEGRIALATDLKVGERVRLVTKTGENVSEVTESSEAGFKTREQPESGEVFVYGREVNDFRTVDYDAISMLNVSATQQLKKEKDAEVKSLQSENGELRSKLSEQEKRLAELEAKDKAREAKLAAIEKALLDGGGSAATERTVSLKKARSVK